MQNDILMHEYDDFVLRFTCAVVQRGTGRGKSTLTIVDRQQFRQWCDGSLGLHGASQAGRKNVDVVVHAHNRDGYASARHTLVSSVTGRHSQILRDRPVLAGYDERVKVDIAAVVVTYNSEEHVGALLDSIPSALGELSGSVVVVDNGSTDGTLAILDGRDDCVAVRSENVGYAAGMNRAVAESPEAGAILILNPDATLDADSVPRMLSVLQKPGVGIVAPRVREADGSLSPTLRRSPSLGRVGGLSFTGWAYFTERIEDPQEYEREHDVDWAVGAILLVDATCYSSLDGMDESYFLYSEETDLSLRARDAGWSTRYTPEAGAVHVGGGSGESATTHMMKILNRIRIYRRRSGPVRGWLYFWSSVAIELRRALLGHRRSWPTVRALVRPSERPPALGVNGRLIPR